MPPDETDVRLRERLVAGDDDALAEAYDRWANLIHVLAARITDDAAAAEDITQDVFVRLWQAPEAYDPERGALRTWLCMLARSRALDWTRRREARARYHAVATATGAVVPDQPDVDDAVIWRTETKVVREAVQALPDLQREAVQLAYYHGHTYRQVARELNIPEGTAKSRLRLALSNIADRLAAEGILER
ncbi:sigma-70 family RNA polymerase sigma factor [Phytohabitans rumicis]|uniref:RNA polymerase sigma factor n=1 Tax=Phytohabitans rumicis TaxID=1076125 RepID=A0A6V8LNP1_9ACTN|nr:sigma-70 family RNA polymerase sigma factor [Phytohabitans rumicis]GFJ94315.1 RNA polymerase sigma factor [Phytohabitans rumicis]